MGDGFIWACSGVYGPNDNILRGQMWDELIGIQQLWEVPWCFIGDFNIVRFLSERLGGSRLTPAMENFSEFIEELSLIDLPLEERSYTWSSGSDQPNIKKQSFTHVHSPWNVNIKNFFMTLKLIVWYKVAISLQLKLIPLKFGLLLKDSCSFLWYSVLLLSLHLSLSLPSPHPFQKKKERKENPRMKREKRKVRRIQGPCRISPYSQKKKKFTF